MFTTWAAVNPRSDSVREVRLQFSTTLDLVFTSDGERQRFRRHLAGTSAGFRLRLMVRKKSSETKETRKKNGQKFCGNGKWVESGKILMLVRSGKYPKMINRMANESAAGTVLWRWWGKGWFYPVLSKLPPCNVGAKHVPRESNLWFTKNKTDQNHVVIAVIVGFSVDKRRKNCPG